MQTQLTEEQLAEARVAAGGFLELSKFTTDQGHPREVVFRRDGTVHACKVMPIFLNPYQAEDFELRGRVELDEMVDALRAFSLQVKVGILAHDRPITYLPGHPLSENFIYEFPGGVVDHGETFKEGGLRELREELKIPADDVLASTLLLPESCYSQGIFQEWTSVLLAVCTGEMNPVADEGIIPERSKMVRFNGIPCFLAEAGQQGIGVECHIRNGYNAVLACVAKTGMRFRE